MSVAVLNRVDFDQIITEADKTILVDFYADWCGPCRMLAPVLHELALEKADSVEVYKVNIDENMELAQRFSVMSIPTVIAFKSGEAIARQVGLHPKRAYEQMIGK